MFGGTEHTQRLYTQCQQLFGQIVEENFHTPANMTLDKLLCLEYLFSQSTGESGPFYLSDISKDGPSPEEEVIQPGQSDPEVDNNIVLAIPAHITHTTDDTTAAHSPAFVSNFVFTSTRILFVISQYIFDMEYYFKMQSNVNILT